MASANNQPSHSLKAPSLLQIQPTPLARVTKTATRYQMPKIKSIQTEEVESVMAPHLAMYPSLPKETLTILALELWSQVQTVVSLVHTTIEVEVQWTTTKAVTPYHTCKQLSHHRGTTYSSMEVCEE